MEGSRALQMTWFIGMVLRDGQYFGLSCAQAESCAGPIQIPSLLREQPARERIWKEVKQVFSPKPESYYAPAISKGEDSCRVKEAVVRITYRGLDLGDAVTIVGAMPCVLDLRAIDAEGTLRELAVTATVKVEADVKVVAANVPPGLYRLEVRDEVALTPEWAWVRVVDAKRPGWTVEDFARAQDLVATWPADALSAQRTFLRALLAAENGGR